MMEISNTTKTKINSKRITAISEAFLKKFKPDKTEVSLALVGDQRIRRLNRDYRKIDKATDVLSFSSAPWEKKLLGEIIINPQEIKRLYKYREILEFTGFNYPPKNLKKAENYLFYFILVHGLLHLIGYDDAQENDRLIMLKLGRDFLAKRDIM